MLEYTTKTTTVVAACTCNRCQRRLTPDELEWHERLSISYQAGYSSVFGDGNVVSLDLCQQCVAEVLGPWLQIKGSDETLGEQTNSSVSEPAKTWYATIEDANDGSGDGVLIFPDELLEALGWGEGDVLDCQDQPDGSIQLQKIR